MSRISLVVSCVTIVQPIRYPLRFCLTNTLAIASRQEMLRRAIVCTVKTDLEGGGYIVGAPPDESAPHREHTQKLLDRLLWRRKAHPTDIDVVMTKSNTTLQEKMTSLHSLLQAPWWQDQVTHYCTGPGCICGGSRDKAIASIAGIVLWVCLTSMPSTPSFSRWTTLGPCVAWFSLAVLIHSVFDRSWALAFQGERSKPQGDLTEQLDDAGLADFSKILGRRMKKAGDFLKSASSVIHTVTIALATEPIDTLILRMLHFDVNGKLLLDIMSKRVSPIEVAMVHLSSMLDGEVSALLLTHFRLQSDAALDEHFGSLRSIVCELMGNVFYRLSF